MSDPLRTDLARHLDGGSEANRDAKIEELLVVGLDHYFAAQYEQAINVWTRALFLDRSHAKARAYIERARSALAERQRESEELLHNGVAAFNRGEGGEARRLLQAAMNQGAPPDEALAVLDRLNRLEQDSLKPEVSKLKSGRREISDSRPETSQVSLPEGRRSSPWVGIALLGVAIVLVATAAFIVLTSTPIDWGSLLTLQTPQRAAPVVSPASESALPVPRRGEELLARARALAAGGHLRDALAALDSIRPTDAQRPDADRLRADIQRQIMALAAPATAVEARPVPDDPVGQSRQP